MKFEFELDKRVTLKRESLTLNTNKIFKGDNLLKYLKNMWNS
jgi:hypothetical protein